MIVGGQTCRRVRAQRCAPRRLFVLGRSMAQGQRLTDWQVETIRLAYAETGSVSHAAHEAGCAFNTAKKYVNDHRDDLTKLRTEKKADVIAQVAALRIRLLEEMHSTTR